MEIGKEYLHRGHRARMRSKLLMHGARIFDTYELLEMLLYYGIPRRDTNPVAKTLLMHFGSLDALMSASVEEIRAAGVPPRAAKLINTVGKADYVGQISKDVSLGECYDDCERVGLLLADFLRHNTEYNAAVMLLDDSMRLLGVSGVETPKFGSAATTAKPFVDAAISLGATGVVLAFTNRNKLLYPFDSDVVTCRMIGEELGGIGVNLLSAYITDGGRFAIAGPKIQMKSAATPEMKRFCDSASCFIARDGSSEPALLGFESRIEGSGEDARLAVEDFLRELLSLAGQDSSLADRLVSRYGALDALLCDRAERIADTSSEQCAVLMKLTAALTSRRVTDAFSFGARHDMTEIMRYFEAVFYGLSDENVYMMSFDERGRALSCDLVGEGVVNAADIYSRRVLECISRSRAKSVILAHNHPTGAAAPSQDDVMATATIFSACRSVGVRVSKHVIFARREHYALEPDAVTGAVLGVGRLF